MMNERTGALATEPARAPTEPRGSGEPRAPGRTTLTSALDGAEPAGLQRAARAGVAGAATELPHLAAIQRSFGKHDVTGVRAHVDGNARAATDAIGAEAYATGNSIAFRDASPSLHTAAHEAAHVVQQRAGVSLRGGVGQVDDPYERHADAVADLVVQGKSAEALLDTMTGGGGGGSGSAVQRKAGGVDLSTILSDLDVWGALPFPGAARQAQVVEKKSTKPAGGQPTDQPKSPDDGAAAGDPPPDDAGAPADASPAGEQAPVQLKMSRAPKPPSGSLALPGIVGLTKPQVSSNGVGGDAGEPSRLDNCISWANDDAMGAGIDQLDTKDAALRGYITAETAKCGAAVDSDIGSLRELDATSHNTLVNYHQDLEKIKELHDGAKKDIARAQKKTTLSTKLKLAKLDDLRDEDKAKINQMLDKLRSRLKAEVGRAATTFEIVSLVAAGDAEGVAIEVGKQIITLFGEQLTDDQIESDAAAWNQSINRQYNALAQELQLATELDSANALDAEISEASEAIAELQASCRAKLATKKQAIARLQATLTSLLTQSTSLTCMPLIMAFLEGATVKGHELRGLIDELRGALSAAPDYAGAAEAIAATKATVQRAIEAAETDAMTYYNVGMAGGAIPSDKRWMFSATFLAYVDEKNRQATGTPDPAPANGQTCEPKMDEYSAAFFERLQEAEDYLANIDALTRWTGAMDTWKTDQHAALQAELAFVSGEHVAPANQLLERVMLKLGPGSSNQVRAARRAGGK